MYPLRILHSTSLGIPISELIGVLTECFQVTGLELVWEWFIHIVSPHYNVSYLELLGTYCVVVHGGTHLVTGVPRSIVYISWGITHKYTWFCNIHIQEAELCVLLHTQIKMRSLHQMHNPSHWVKHLAYAQSLIPTTTTTTTTRTRQLAWLYHSTPLILSAITLMQDSQCLMLYTNFWYGSLIAVLWIDIVWCSHVEINDLSSPYFASTTTLKMPCW